MVKIIRLRETSEGTEGMLMAPGGFKCSTFELPWKGNQRNISCIPVGTYNVEMRMSPKFGFVYWVKRVPDRSYILIHSGNFAGDVSKGKRTHVNGCILLGEKFGYLNNQRAILNSRVYLRKFINHMNKKPFILEISKISRVMSPGSPGLEIEEDIIELVNEV
jgi:hypothetical protein